MLIQEGFQNSKQTVGSVSVYSVYTDVSLDFTKILIKWHY